MRHRFGLVVVCCVLLTAMGCHSETVGKSSPVSSETSGGPELEQAEQSATGDVALLDIPANSLDGSASSLGAHRGKAILVVNVASECGYTYQYEGLERLQDKYGERGLVVVGFPCNQFGGQEPGSAEEIRDFCTSRFGVSFPLYEKVEVNGPGRHPIFAKLTAHADASGDSGDIKWNFEKFLISPAGEVVARFRTKTEPEDPSVVAAIEKVLPTGGN